MQCGSISVARSVGKILAFEDFVLPLIIKTFNISDKLPVKINQNHNQETQMHISNDGKQIILITDQDNALLINLEKRDKEHIVEEDCSNVVIGPDCGSKFLAVNNGNHFLVFEKKENEANYKGIFYLRNELLLDELISLQFNPYFSNIIMTVSVDKIKFYDYRIQRLGQDKSLIHSFDDAKSIKSAKFSFDGKFVTISNGLNQIIVLIKMLPF